MMFAIYKTNFDKLNNLWSWFIGSWKLEVKNGRNNGSIEFFGVLSGSHVHEPSETQATL